MDGLWCKCCGYRLRTKPRNLKFKNNLRKKMGLDTTGEKHNRKEMSVDAAGNITLTEISQDV